MTDGELSPSFLSNPPVLPAATQSLLGIGYVAGKYAQGSLTSGKPFLPQFGVNFKLDKSNEIFADAAYNVRSYRSRRLRLRQLALGNHAGRLCGSEDHPQP